MKGKIKSNVKPVWVSKIPKSNITRVMSEDEAKAFSLASGNSVFTKMKKWELDQL